MALNLSKDLYDQLREHVGHKLTCVGYGNNKNPDNVAIECETCGTVLLDSNRDSVPSIIDLVAEADGDWWGERPYYPRREWRYAAFNGDTQLGYWEWVLHRIEEEEE